MRAKKEGGLVWEREKDKEGCNGIGRDGRCIELVGDGEKKDGEGSLVKRKKKEDWLGGRRKGLGEEKKIKKRALAELGKRKKRVDWFGRRK